MVGGRPAGRPPSRLYIGSRLERDRRVTLFGLWRGQDPRAVRGEETRCPTRIRLSTVLRKTWR